MMLVDVFKGAKTKKGTEKGYDRLQGYGIGRKYTRHDAERLGEFAARDALPPVHVPVRGSLSVTLVAVQRPLTQSP